MKPKVIILRASGTNCDLETKSAFDFVGAKTELVHINELLNGDKKLVDYDIMAIPGGFSFGDDISAGKIFALRIKKLKSDFNDFIKAKKPVIGICNGFQVLVKTGFLPYDIELKQRFVERNVPVNVWPYIREIVATMTAKMGLPPLVLPTLKIVR